MIQSCLCESVQLEPTGCTIYFQFISIINLYMFRVGLLLIIRRYYSVYTTIGICHADNSEVVQNYLSVYIYILSLKSVKYFVVRKISVYVKSY